MHSHRPTSSHQSNKPFKGSSRHKSKGAVKTELAGKVSRTRGGGPKAKSLVDSKVNRRNAVKMHIKKKRDEEKEARRMFTGANAVPKVVAIVPLCPDVSCQSLMDNLSEVYGRDIILNDGNGLALPGMLDLGSEFKQRLQLIPCDRSSESDYATIIKVLDACKVADFVIYLLSSVTEVDELGNSMIASIKAQGNLPSLSLAQQLDQVAVKSHLEIKKSLLSFMKDQTCQELTRIYDQSQTSDLKLLIRAICSSPVAQLKWREYRPYLLAENIQFVPCIDDDSVGTLQVNGYARGHPFCADRLVHIPTFGDFQVESISELQSSKSFVANSENQQQQVFCNKVEDQNDSEGEDDFQSVMMTETGSTRKTIRKVPKGTSEYQAEWIIDESDGDDGDMSASEEEHQEELSQDELSDSLEVGQEYDEEDDIGSEEEQDQFEQYMQNRRSKISPKDDLEFPDEEDTPTDIPARYRYRKFRGIKSFRNANWDPYEDLPVAYGRIFQFESFRKTRAKILEFLDGEKILPSLNPDFMDEDGDFNGPQCYKPIQMVIKNVPRLLIQYLQTTGRYLSIFGLLSHEEKISLLNMTFTRAHTISDDSDFVLENKCDLVVQCGFRRYRANMLMSQYSNGNLHRMERFAHPGHTVMMSLFGQIHITPSEPVLFFSLPENTDHPILIGTGSLESIEPSRMIIERKVLTGIPTRINPSHHRNTATIRFMFFNCEDIAYFKPVDIYTKLGRRGRILSSIGTHGAMKCEFDKPLKSMDTVCMSLYKRVFPTWPSNGYESIYGTNVAIQELNSLAKMQQ